MGKPTWLIQHIQGYGFKYEREKKSQLTFWNGEKFIFLPKGKRKLHEAHVRDILKNKCKMTDKEIAAFIKEHRKNIHS